MSEKNAYEWITDRPPTSADTSQRHYWCVDVVSRSGPVVGMRWDDAELQDFPEKQTSVVAWRTPVTEARGVQ